MRIRDAESEEARMVCGVNRAKEMIVHTVPGITIVEVLASKGFSTSLL